MTSRRKARELALMALFQDEFKDQKGENPFPEHDETPDQEAQQYSLLLSAGVRDKRTDIDRVIQDYTRNWKIDRMALVDRNILRIAVFELQFSDQTVPMKTVINEAVELAKKFGSTESRAFVNGVLDKAARTLKN